MSGVTIHLEVSDGQRRREDQSGARVVVIGDACPTLANEDVQFHPTVRQATQADCVFRLYRLWRFRQAESIGGMLPIAPLSAVYPRAIAHEKRQAFIADMVGAVAAIKRHVQISFRRLRCSMSARSIGRPTVCFSAIMSSMEAITAGTSPARKVTA